MLAAKVKNFDMHQISQSKSQSIDFDQIIRDEKIKIKTSRKKGKSKAIPEI
jgi:hypothetical protein